MGRGSQNLIPGQHKLTLEEQSAGGRRSVEVRRERKKTMAILRDFLDQDVESIPKFKATAQKIGLNTSDLSIHDLATAVYFMNSLKKGGLQDMQRLAFMLGDFDEPPLDPEESVAKMDPLTKSLMEEARRMDEETKAEGEKQDADQP